MTNNIFYYSRVEEEESDELSDVPSHDLISSEILVNILDNETAFLKYNLLNLGSKV